jgi:hypothetical protein
MFKIILVGVVAFGFGLVANNFVTKYEISAIKPAQAAIDGKNSQQLLNDPDFRAAVTGVAQRDYAFRAAVMNHIWRDCRVYKHDNGRIICRP